MQLVFGIIPHMRKLITFLAFLAVAGASSASWYWPFGSDDDAQKPVRRLSEIMEPVSLLIDEASDLAADGKPQEAVEKYREALKGLDEIEAEDPSRAEAPEFATVRNKRAYVNAAIDSLLLAQVQSNSKSVAVSDTTELEKKLAEEKKSGRRGTGARKVLTRRERIMDDIDAGRFDSAASRIEEMLAEKPNGAAALNLKAMMEMAQGKAKDAEKTLDQAIMSNPRSHFAYYNMAELMLRASPAKKDEARRYYETGRAIGGPKDEQLEEALK